MRNTDVARAFVNGKAASATAGNLRTDGISVFSYGDRIAWWQLDQQSIRTKRHGYVPGRDNHLGYTITGRHIRLVRDAAYAAGYEESPEENTQDWEVWR